MNISLLTIDSTLAATMGTSSVAPKSDEIRKGPKFSLNEDDKHPQANSLEKPTAYNINEEVQSRKEPINKSPQEFTQSIRKRTKPYNPCDAENNTKPQEKNEAPVTTKQPSEQQNLIKSWLAKHTIFVEHNKEGTDTKIEPKAGQHLAQIIANTQTGKSSPVTGDAVKSAEIKLLHTTEKGQLGLKTVLPVKSEGQNGLKAILPNTSKNTSIDKKQPEATKNTDKVSVLAKTIAVAKSVTEKGSTKELAPEVSANTGKITTTTSEKPLAVNINPPSLQAKAPQTQPQSAGIDPEKPVPTEEADAKTTASETLSKLLNPNGKETINTGNNLSENQSVQKLNIAATQVSTGQAKDQGTSMSYKNASQAFEQMLSHNTSQTLITEQAPAAAKNATTANMPGQTSSNEVSEDIGKQILESIHQSISRQSAEKQITVRLNPPELGKVFIKFRQQDAELTGLMEVSKPQTRSEIEQTLPQIIRNLADSGIHIKRLEVVLSNEGQPGQGTLGNQSTQSGGAHQHNSANPGTPGNNSDANESNDWLAGSNSYENLYELQEALITDGSINMLI